METKKDLKSNSSLRKVNDGKVEENSFSENFKEYLLSSSLHGLRYIGTVTLSIFERVFFSLAFFSVMLLAAYFISNIWQKWKESPVIIGLDPVSTSIKDFPFPAVTICNMNQVKKNFADNLTENRDKLILESICSQGDNIPNNDDTIVEGKWPYVREFLMNSSQRCKDMLKFCRFGTKDVDCDQNFMSVLTDEGLCCTFNGIHPKLLFKNFNIKDMIENDEGEVDYKTWTPETGYEKSNQSHYPRPVQGPGSNMGLTLLLDADVSNYYCSSTNSYGFKILLHSPIETPKMSNFAFSIATGQETKIVITPRISEASNLIRKVPINKRQCVFESEANLSFYNIYSMKNCEMECSSKTMQEKCGCTLYYMPRNYDNESKICNRRQSSCYEGVLFNISYSLNEVVTCNDCLPACFEVNYGREISSAKLGGVDFSTAYSLSEYTESYISKNLAMVHIYFLENAYGGYTKNELIGFTEFLSNTGGLLGLFMGFSVISLIEIFYFLSFRPYCARRNTQKLSQNQVKPSIDVFFGPKVENHKKSSLFHVSIMEKIHMKLSKFWEGLKEFWKDGDGDDESLPPYPYCN